ncbi:MAG: DUF4159 domain-containing protein [Vicinamibacterales bacterium]
MSQPVARSRRIPRRGLVIAALLVCVAVPLLAQQPFIWGGYYGRTPPRFASETSFNGGFNFCRAMFQSNRREKQGWGTDYPGADINFSIRLAELTKVQVRMRPAEQGPDLPDAVVVRLTDDNLFRCPFVLMEDAGTAHFSDAEVARLRDYLLKGGFLFVSDYHGSWAREQFDQEIGRVLSPTQFPPIDLEPPDHPIWHTFFDVTKIPQLASINTWRRSGGDTIERWNETGAPPNVRGIADEHGRLLVVMAHNTDIPDAWEREGEDPQYFYSFSPEAYAVGIDVLLYAMTH